MLTYGPWVSFEFILGVLDLFDRVDFSIDLRVLLIPAALLIACTRRIVSSGLVVSAIFSVFRS